MNTNEQKTRRKNRIRAKLRGTDTMPRLTIFRSNKHVLLQLINDDARKTIASVSEKELGTKKMKRMEKSKALGILIAKKALALGLQKVVFDRAGYAYHGNVKAAAEGARQGGLQF